MAQPNVPEVPVYEGQMIVRVVATQRFMASYLHLNKVVFMDPECPLLADSVEKLFAEKNTRL